MRNFNDLVNTIKELEKDDLWQLLSAVEMALREKQTLVQYPHVIITCEGGLITDVISPLPIRIFIADYDIEGSDPTDVTNDLACCQYRTPAPISDIDPDLAKTLEIFMKETLNYEPTQKDQH